MANAITINIKNDSGTSQSFYIFQHPSVFSGTGQVYSNSLFTSPLLPYDQSGAILTVTMMLQADQAFAGAQQRTDTPQIGQLSGGTTALQQVTLTSPAVQQPANTTTLSIAPLGLSPATYSSGLQDGAFRIMVSRFDPALYQFNAGTAVQNLDLSVTLSNFVTAQSLTNLDCQPVLVFYVQIGNLPPRTVIDYTSVSQNAAACDFRPGYATYAVVYNEDGTWSTTPYRLKRLSSGDEVLVVVPTDDSSQSQCAGPL